MQPVKSKLSLQPIERYAIFKKITRLAVPLIAVQVAQMGMQVVDSLMLGQLGPNALAVGALGGVIIYNILVFCIGLLSAVGVLLAQAYGAKDSLAMSHRILQGVTLAMALSLPCVILISIFPNVLLHFGLSIELASLTEVFLNALAWGVPGALVFIVLRDFAAVLGHARLAMLISIAAIPLNGLLNYVLMYGKLGLPALGVAGVGYATSIVRWAMVVGLTIYIFQHKELSQYINLKLKAWFNFADIKKILLLGYPSGIMMGLEIGMFSVVTVLMGFFGVNALAAHQIAIQCANVVFTIPMGISQATGIEVAYVIGASQRYLTSCVTYMAMMLGIACACVIALFFIFLPLPIINSFLDTHNLYNLPVLLLAIRYLSIAGILQFLDTIQIIAIGALRGMHDTFMPMILSVIAYWALGLSAAYIFAYRLHLQGTGLWYGLCIGIGLSALLLLMRFRWLETRVKLHET